VKLLEEYGAVFKHPYCSGAGRPYRVLYAFDPRRTAILLIGGDKTGNDRWYETFVPMADRIYSHHLEQLHKEGEI